jgi:hypothetical protein
VTRRSCCCFVTVVVLLAGCGSSTAAPPVSPPVVGPCAGRSPGCGTSSGTAAALAAGRWATLPTAPLATRADDAVVWTGEQLLVWGGVRETTSGVFDDGAAFDTSAGRWQMLRPSPLPAREDPAAVWAGDQMIVWGGDDGGDQTTRREYADGAAYVPTTRTWRLLPAAPLGPRSGPAMFWTGSEVLVFGGLTPERDLHQPVSATELLDGAIYVPGTRRWTSLPAYPQGAAGVPVGATVAWAGDRLIVWATYEVWHISGSSAEMTNSRVIASWTPGAAAWQRIPTPPPTEPGALVYGAQPFWTGTKVILLGSSYCLPGEWSCPAPFPGGPSGWLNDPTTGQRAAMAPDAVAADIGPTTWTGQALVVVNDGGTIGGPNGATTLRPGDGAAYDPATNSWTTLPRSPILDLSDASAVWTGTEVLVTAAPQGSRYVQAEALVAGASPASSAVPASPANLSGGAPNAPAFQ